MEEFRTDWSREELKAYILLYCANANFVETKEEKDFILSKVGEEKYQKIHKEFDDDNDYQQIQKIQHTVQRFEYSKDEIDRLFNNIKKMFLADGSIDIMEKNIYRGLKHLLK
ncbi:hypothetical protein [Aequorivita lipolytica]|uniref:TerB family tellurite resistance protein n=1 Tax=Aequorivita lipolytica TaxID=153267 RepID=A0A5C6YPA4_9FLAO|nr:hypothetical protein [Aequorivita lipolytica]TXD68874.1 hypothetical protein ESV24_10505 [Aequorivita lipolytica]SRX52135.1 hypothetical protein AEQU2_02114 [Aequorivita lipolytica]